VRPGGQHGDDHLGVLDRLGHRGNGAAPGLGGALQRGGRQVEGGDVMPGLGLIGGHAAAHVAETDEGDASHLRRFPYGF